MHPGFMGWWHAERRRAAECGHRAAGCGPGGGWAWHHAGGADDAGAFGVRRPLRFLVHRLELDEKQAARLARIIDELKTERAQASVDDRRTTAAFADAVAGESFDAAGSAAAAERRVESARRLRDAVVKALGEIHAMLNAEQRETLAYLIRTGALSV
jgi:Spy/CpxP family protein refolding chaperone